MNKLTELRVVLDTETLQMLDALVDEMQQGRDQVISTLIALEFLWRGLGRPQADAGHSDDE